MSLSCHTGSVCAHFAYISFGKGQNRDVKNAPQDISSSGVKKIFVTLLTVWLVTSGMHVVEKGLFNLVGGPQLK